MDLINRGPCDESELAEAHDLAHLLHVLADDGAGLLGALLTYLVEVVGVGIDLVVTLYGSTGLPAASFEVK